MNHSDAEEEDGGIHSYFDYQILGTSRASVDDDTEQLTPMCQPHQRQKHPSENSSLISRIKQNFSTSPISQFLGNHARTSSGSSEVDHEVDHSSMPQESHTPTRCLSNFRNVFSSSRSNSQSRSNTSSSTCSNSSASSQSIPGRKFSLCASSKQSPLTECLGTPSSQLDSPTLTMSSVADDTPPVTPCLPTEAVIHTVIAGDEGNGQVNSASIKIRDESSVSNDAKKGKEPAPPFVRDATFRDLPSGLYALITLTQPYETLIADISGAVDAKIPEVVEEDNGSEWWGLEYTLELSRKDSRTSDASEETGGEHSKVCVSRFIRAAFDDVSLQSRESWAAIHQGTVPPVYEDTDFHEWQKWHRSLDKMEMKRCKRRTIEFIEESDRQATIFVYEMQARRALELYVRILFP